MNAIEFENRISESRAFIKMCELGDCQPVTVAKRASMDFKDEVDEQPPGAFVTNDTIISIVAGMSKKNREAVTDCLLLASLAADFAFPEGGLGWYRTYLTTLGSCGWTYQSKGTGNYKASSSKFTMEQEGLEILASAIATMALPGPTSVLLLKVAKDAIGVLQKSEKPLRIFETSSKKRNGAKFAIGTAVETKDKEVVMAMAAMDFSTSLNVTNVLFWEWSSSSVSIQSADNKLSLNQRHFAAVADEVRTKLTESAREKIAKIEF